MKSIVVPISFSETGLNAARYAADLALAVDADLRLVHVVETPATAAVTMMTGYLFEEMRNNASKSIAEAETMLYQRTREKIPIWSYLESGDLLHRVKALCDEIEPFAIVIGASSHNLDSLIAGSSASSLIRLHEPVLVVPPGAKFQQFRRIALACETQDIESELPHSMGMLAEFHRRFNPKFDIITVETRKNWTGADLYLRTTAWMNKLKLLQPEIHFICNTHIEEGLKQYLTDHPADLAVVFPKNHHFAEFHVSQSRKFARTSPIPVMNLHE